MRKDGIIFTFEQIICIFEFLLVLVSIYIFDISYQIIFVWVLLQKSAGYIRLLSSTKSYRTDISVYRFNGNFNPYKLVWFDAGQSKNQSTLFIFEV